MFFNTVFTILFIISGKALAQAQVKDTAHSWKEMCSPIQANVHEPLRFVIKEIDISVPYLLHT